VELKPRDAVDSIDPGEAALTEAEASVVARGEIPTNKIKKTNVCRVNIPSFLPRAAQRWLSSAAQQAAACGRTSGRRNGWRTGARRRTGSGIG
jgi:hypothetical protein